jgi:hypothetical protein
MSAAAELHAEFLMQLAAEFADAEDLGDTPLGGRRILKVRRGSFRGPQIEGELLPGGGDWVLVRADGVAQLDIRFTLRAHDGAMVYVSSSGLLDIAPQLRRRILQGEEIDPGEYYFRTVLAFETGAQKYRWLNRLLAVGVGRRTAAGMVTDVFALT